MFVLLLLAILFVDNISAIHIEQSPKHFTIKENSPSGTLIGVIRTYPSDCLMTLIDDANGYFHLDSIGQLIVSNCIYSYSKS